MRVGLLYLTVVLAASALPIPSHSTLATAWGGLAHRLPHQAPPGEQQEAMPTPGGGIEPPTPTPTPTPDPPPQPAASRPANVPLNDPVFSNAEDSIRYSLDGRRVYLFGGAVVKYQNMELQADHIELDMETNLVFARGRLDSAGVAVGRPVFKEGNRVFRMDSIRYHLETQRAKIYGVITEEAGGFLHSRETKRMENNVINVRGGKFTTCDHEDPHFYIAISRAKAIPDRVLISGPAHLVIEDVPLPLGIPFGFFPSTQQRASGIILPEYGEEFRRGFFLRGGGVYLGISDYMDMTVTGSIYSRGSWQVTARSAYRVRYRYRGSFSLDFSENVIGERGLEGFSRTQSYWLRWSHAQDPKAHPNRTFQASVNFGSPNHNRYNARTIDSYLANSITSSVSFSRVWPGTPFNFTASMNHSQNNLDSTITIGLPRASFTMSRQFPFRPRAALGPPTWYHRIGISYSASLDNSIATTTDRLFTRQSLRQFRNGIRHDIPISTSFNVLRFINISPSASYTEFWYLQSIERRIDPRTNRVAIDTVPGFVRAAQFSTGISASTRLFGMFTFGERSPVRAVRHVITPSVSLGFRPDFSHPFFGYFRDLETTAPSFEYIRDWEHRGFYRDFYLAQPGRTQRYSIFEQSVFGGPGAGRSGTIGFSLGNNLEMKVRSRRDPATPTRKIRILESLSLSSSYNLMADSLNLSPIGVSGRTTLFEQLSVNFGGTLDPYALDAQGRIYDRFLIQDQRNPFRLTSARVSFGFSLSSRTLGQGGRREANAPPPMDEMPLEEEEFPLDPEETPFGQSMTTQFDSYVDFDVPWSLNVNYSFNYSKPGRVRSVNQTLGFSGDLSLSPKWRIGFQSGLDMNAWRLTTTSINFFRDLHCWAMRLTVIPLGHHRSFSFQINVKSSVLQDLKITKRQSHLDNL